MFSAARPVKVLLVEDNETDVLMAREALKDSPVEIELHVIDNGVDAIRFLSAAEEAGTAIALPDLVLLDWNLPQKSGREVLHEIKTDDRLKRIPVVVLTTSEAEDDIGTAYDLHANSFVTKPLDFAQFRAALRATERFWFHVASLPPRAYG